jgi:hypothetical protein
MNTAITHWRCGNCGISTPSNESECLVCGGSRVHRSQEKLRLLSAALSNENNGYVQNNVNNVAVHGNVHLGNQVVVTDDDEDDEKYERRSRRAIRKHRSPLESFVLFTSGIVMWMSVLVLGGIASFFIAVIWTAYHH